MEFSIFLLALCSLSTSFPTNHSNSYTFNVNPTSRIIQTSYIQIESSIIIMYTPILASNGLQCDLYRIDLTASPATLVTSNSLSFSNAISSPVISFMDAQLLLFSAAETNTGASIMVRLNRNTLATISSTTVPKKAVGVYLSAYDLFFYHQGKERLLQSPSGSNSQISDFSPLTSYVEKIKYFYAENHQKLFAFLWDKAFFYKRDIITSVSNITWQLQNPQSISMTGTGYQCICFGYNKDSIYILDRN